MLVYILYHFSNVFQRQFHQQLSNNDFKKIMDSTNFKPVPTAPPSEDNPQNPTQHPPQYNLPPPSYNQALVSSGEYDQTVYQPPPQSGAVYQPPPQSGAVYQPPPQSGAVYQPPPQSGVVYQPPTHSGVVSNIQPIMISRLPDEIRDNQGWTPKKIKCCILVFVSVMLVAFLPMIIILAF